jgi:hypothetical protein
MASNSKWAIALRIPGPTHMTRKPSTHDGRGRGARKGAEPSFDQTLRLCQA